MATPSQMSRLRMLTLLVFVTWACHVLGYKVTATEDGRFLCEEPANGNTTVSKD